MCIYIYMCVCHIQVYRIYTYHHILIYIYTYIYICRERERERSYLHIFALYIYIKQEYILKHIYIIIIYTIATAYVHIARCIIMLACPHRILFVFRSHASSSPPKCPPVDPCLLQCTRNSSDTHPCSTSPLPL